jgi:hypothetical protein
MSKGFSAPDPRIAKFIARLSKALKSRNTERLEAILDWGYFHLGFTAIANVLSNIRHNCDLLGIDDEDAEFFWKWQFNILQASPMWPEVSAKARDCLAEILIDEGFTPGKDFSVAPDGMLLVNESAQAELLSHVPETERERLQKMMVGNDQPITLEAIAVAVGVDKNYFDNLFNIAKKRLAPYVMWDDGYFVLNYATNFIEGTLQKFPELRGTNFEFFALGQMASPEAMKRILAKAEDYPDPPEKEEGLALECLWKDIAEATGKAEGNEFSEAEGIGWVVSIHGIKLIGKVWDSKKTPMREMVCLLEKHSRQK